MEDRIGRVLGGRYRLAALIGSGASAQVYLADDRVLGRRVAVKVLHPSLAADQAFLSRFRAEARAAAALSHPNLMAVYDWGEDADGPYLVLEYLGGGSLRAMLDAGTRLSVSQALAVGLDAARALAFAHGQGFVHRDIKPANLLFGEDGRLRIADFGLARALSESGWTDHGDRMVGTARYAAPEQARGERVDGKADVYALGLVMAESITGQVPLTREGPVETLMARLDTPVPVGPEVGALSELLTSMGVPDPKERPEASEVADDLLATARLLPRPEPLPLVGVQLEEPEFPDDDVTVLPGDDRTGVLPSVAPPPPPRRRRTWVLGVVAALVLLLVGGAAAVWAMNRTPAAEVPDVVGQVLADAEAALAEAQSDAGDVAWTVVQDEPEFHETVAAGAVISQDPRGGSSLEDGGTVRLVVSKGKRPVPLPNLANAKQQDLEKLVRDAGFVLGRVDRVNVEDVPVDTVLDWWVGDVDTGVNKPPEAQPGSTISVRVSAGPAARTVPIDLRGKTEQEAKAALEALGLVVTRKESFSNDVAAGRVIGSSPAGGQSVPRGGTVELNVSKGQDLVTVPDVRNLELDEALDRLEAAGFTAGDVSGPSRGRVIATTPAIGTKAVRGTEVDITLR
jgi:serine/threonine-protein kinase